MAIDLHEARVAQFMRQAERSDPRRFQEVCAKYPVLDENDLRYIHEEIELYAGPWIEQLDWSDREVVV